MRTSLERPQVRGIGLDPQTRCEHFHSPLDIIAIRMRCCGEYYACKECHAALAGHAAEVWPCAAWDTPAVLCGNCGCELTVSEYLASGSACPNCRADFNPRCSNHYHFYFETGCGSERSTGGAWPCDSNANAK